MRKALATIVLAASLALIPAAPAAAHYDHWHFTTCQPAPEPLLYNVPSVHGGNMIQYWKNSTGELRTVWPFTQSYGWYGYECGSLGDVMTNYWNQTVCELGYCGHGAIQAFRYGYLVTHWTGPNAYQPQIKFW